MFFFFFRRRRHNRLKNLEKHLLRLTLHWSKLFLFFWPSSVLLWPSCFCCAPHLVCYGAVFFLRWFVLVFVCISAARYLSDVLSQKDAWTYSSRESLYGIQKEAGVSALAPRGSRTRWEKALIVLSFLNWRVVDTDWLMLDPDPEFWPSLVPDPRVTLSISVPQPVLKAHLRRMGQPREGSSRLLRILPLCVL